MDDALVAPSKAETIPQPLRKELYAQRSPMAATKTGLRRLGKVQRFIRLRRFRV
jgi:hypothetical protein